MSPEFIHYGHDKFDKDLFVPVKNIGFVKPVGGLWASPLYSNHSWRDWCLRENFRTEIYFNIYFTFTVNKDAKVYTIDSLNHLRLLSNYFDSMSNRNILDFELIAKEYDAIWLTEEGEIATRYTRPLTLYGWDCESLLVLNPNVIITNYDKTKS